jgi:hypothetical protein
MRGIKKAILGYLVENGKSGASASELSEAIGLPVYLVILALKEIYAEKLGIDSGSRDGEYIVLKSWSKDAYLTGIYDDLPSQPEPAPIGF